MFNLTEWKQTKFYQEAEQEGEIKGEIKGKLKTVPLSLRLGLKPEQIAQELELNLEVQQLQSWESHLKHGDTYRLSEDIIEEFLHPSTVKQYGD
jgi:predicted transposase YdaD